MGGGFLTTGTAYSRNGNLPFSFSYSIANMWADSWTDFVRIVFGTLLLPSFPGSRLFLSHTTCRYLRSYPCTPRHSFRDAHSRMYECMYVLYVRTSIHQTQESRASKWRRLVGNGHTVVSAQQPHQKIGSDKIIFSIVMNHLSTILADDIGNAFLSPYHVPRPAYQYFILSIFSCFLSSPLPVRLLHRSR